MDALHDPHVAVALADLSDVEVPTLLRVGLWVGGGCLQADRQQGQCDDGPGQRIDPQPGTVADAAGVRGLP